MREGHHSEPHIMRVQTDNSYFGWPDYGVQLQSWPRVYIDWRVVM